jgi:hypothetical protein
MDELTATSVLIIKRTYVAYITVRFLVRRSYAGPLSWDTVTGWESRSLGRGAGISYATGNCYRSQMFASLYRLPDSKVGAVMDDRAPRIFVALHA